MTRFEPSKPLLKITKRLVLASGSQARQTLLRQAGLDIIIAPAAVDEDAVMAAARQSVRQTTPGEVDEEKLAEHMAQAARGAALDLACAKALDRTPHYPGHYVVGGDQILLCGDRFYSKAADRAEALENLRHLRGRTHVLVTAVCLARDGAVLWRHLDCPALTMKNLDDEALASYADRAGAGLLNTAGGYELEGPGLRLFEKIEGDYFSILGLPLLPLLNALDDIAAQDEEGTF